MEKCHSYTNAPVAAGKRTTIGSILTHKKKSPVDQRQLPVTTENIYPLGNKVIGKPDLSEPRSIKSKHLFYSNFLQLLNIKILSEYFFAY
jgi:hypothetical protein